jgi:transcriptional antiterminator NusG
VNDFGSKSEQEQGLSADPPAEQAEEQVALASEEAEESPAAAAGDGAPDGDGAPEEAASEEAAPADGGDAPNGAEGEEAPAEPAEGLGVPGLDWYIIHTYSGFENKVRESLRTRCEAFGYGGRIGEILIPTEDVVEMRAGKKVTTKRLLYPGYVLVQLDLDDELWHVVKNTPRVTGFVGGGLKPNPLTADEVNQILYRQTASAERPRPKMHFERNDHVKIIDGPFANFSGSVEEVNEDRSTLKVMVTIFGRGTPVELEYFQVEREG